MTRLRIACFSVSLDGFGAGPAQDLQNPLGIGGKALHDWAFKTRSFGEMHGDGGGTEDADDEMIRRGFNGIGAWIMGRNMFTWERGAWANHDWTGWWGDEPPYHCPVFVLTHHPRPSFELGETTFHFVTDGLDSALARAAEAARGRDIRLGGGVATLREALGRGLVDEAHVAVAPVLLGRGEALWPGLDLPALGYRRAEVLMTGDALHTVWQRA
jgi:dihydrofolate reductase